MQNVGMFVPAQPAQPTQPAPAPKAKGKRRSSTLPGGVSLVGWESASAQADEGQRSMRRGPQADLTQQALQQKWVRGMHAISHGAGSAQVMSWREAAEGEGTVYKTILTSSSDASLPAPRKMPHVDKKTAAQVFPPQETKSIPLQVEGGAAASGAGASLKRPREDDSAPAALAQQPAAVP